MNVNPVQIMQLMKNPQNFTKQILNNAQVMQNPILRNAVEMVDKGDVKGLEQLARNLCEEKGVNADEMFNKMKNQIGM